MATFTVSYETVAVSLRVAKVDFNLRVLCCAFRCDSLDVLRAIAYPRLAILRLLLSVFGVSFPFLSCPLFSLVFFSLFFPIV